MSQLASSAPAIFPNEQIVTDDLDLLLDALPPRIVEQLHAPERRIELLEVVMDLGRLPEARYPGREVVLSHEEVTEVDLQFVIDHIGKFLEPVTPDSKEFRSLLGLLDTGRCWVKISAPYETSKTGGPKYEDVGTLVKALVKKAPERMLYASNWPHPSVPREQRSSDEELMDLLLDWAPNEADRRRMLVDNPAELYGF